MKTVIAIVVFVAGLAYAQAPNSCVYAYSFKLPLRDSFAFCLTEYGTLASLQNPVGNEQLDAANPLEGFSVTDTSGSIPLNMTIYPGFDTSQGPPTVKQPVGAGKLPIVFTYTYGDVKLGQVISIVTATPADKTVVFTMKVGKYVFQQYTCGSGPIVRRAGLLVDGQGGNVFDSSGYAASSYNPVGHGVVLSGVSCSGQGVCGPAYGSVGSAFGQNEVQEQGSFDTVGLSTAVFSYKAF
jgi:hypothetical protein